MKGDTGINMYAPLGVEPFLCLPISAFFVMRSFYCRRANTHTFTASQLPSLRHNRRESATDGTGERRR